MLKWEAGVLVKLQAAGWHPVQPLQLFLISPQQGSGSGAACESKWQRASKFESNLRDSTRHNFDLSTCNLFYPWDQPAAQNSGLKICLFVFPWIELKRWPPLNTRSFFVTIKYLRCDRSSVMMLKFPAFFSCILVYLDGIVSEPGLDTRIIEFISFGAILNRRGSFIRIFWNFIYFSVSALRQLK